MRKVTVVFSCVLDVVVVLPSLLCTLTVHIYTDPWLKFRVQLQGCQIFRQGVSLWILPFMPLLADGINLCKTCCGYLWRLTSESSSVTSLIHRKTFTVKIRRMHRTDPLHFIVSCVGVVQPPVSARRTRAGQPCQQHVCRHCELAVFPSAGRWNDERFKVSRTDKIRGSYRRWFLKEPRVVLPKK